MALSNHDEHHLEMPKVLIPPRERESGSPVVEWTYEQRRQAQEIIPGLFLGPLGVIQDGTFLVTQGIALIISVMSPKINQSIHFHTRFAHSDITCVAVDPGDNGVNSTALVGQFVETNALIDASLALDQAVLVMCETGNNKSVALVAAYLVQTQGLGYVEAVQLIQSYRFSISIDEVVKRNLQAFEDICMARVHVNGMTGDLARKRSREEDDGDELQVRQSTGRD